MKAFAFLLQSPALEAAAIVGALLAQYGLLFLILPGLLRRSETFVPERGEFAFRLLILLVVANGALIVSAMLEVAAFETMRMGLSAAVTAVTLYFAHRTLFGDVGPEIWATFGVVAFVNVFAMIAFHHFFG